VLVSTFQRRKLLYFGGATTVLAGAGLALWPSEEAHASYPFARRLVGKAEPLWQIPPERLESASADDARRMCLLVPQLESAVEALEHLTATLVDARVGSISASERARLRAAWWQVFEPILAIDEIKSRYRAWYGLDYLKRPLLHARGFALAYIGLCAQVEAGLRLLKAVDDKKVIRALFDEAMPELGLPRHTFSGLRGRIARARDLFLVPMGSDWYERWISPKLEGDAPSSSLAKKLDTLRRKVKSMVLTPTDNGVENKVEAVASELARRWFPLQKGFAEWAGDTRFADQARRLINDAQLVDFKAKLEPGDIILERRNWYLSNVGLPGFWPHAALYTGNRDKLAALAADVEVKQRFGDYLVHLARHYPAAWKALGERDASGHEHSVVEAVSEGVVCSSIEHSCGADYAAALRPLVSPLNRALAIERAFSFFGRPYDFDFDFVTDDQVVCSELVVKAYEAVPSTERRLEVPYVEILGRRAVPPTEFVKKFRAELGRANAELEFVYFLDGREGQRAAVVGSAEDLAATCDRPKWDIIQP
jgi:hypothetical protein